MVHAADDLAIVGHMGDSSITRFPSGHLVAYIDKWKVPHGTSGHSRREVTRRLTSTEDQSYEHKKNSTTVLPVKESIPRFSYIDVSVEQVDHLSESGTIYSYLSITISPVFHLSLFPFLFLISPFLYSQ